MYSKSHIRSIVAEKKERIREEKLAEIERNELHIEKLMMDVGLKVKKKETDSCEKKEKIILLIIHF